MSRGALLALALAGLGVACGVKGPPRPPKPRPATPPVSEPAKATDPPPGKP